MKPMTLVLPFVCGLLLAGWLHSSGGVGRGDGKIERANVLTAALGAAVQVFAVREDGARRTGSGVALATDDNGRVLIVTAAHVVDAKAEWSLLVKTPMGDQRFPAKLLDLDEARDIAFLEVAGIDATPVSMAPSAQLGDDIWVVSFPWGRDVTVVNGAVSQLSQSVDTRHLPLRGGPSLIDAAVSYGTSGGGIFDAQDGRMVGIVRGYRTAKLALPGSADDKLEFPIAGETTVIPATAIICRLKAGKAARWSRIVESAGHASCKGRTG